MSRERHTRKQMCCAPSCHVTLPTSSGAVVLPCPSCTVVLLPANAIANSIIVPNSHLTDRRISQLPAPMFYIEYDVTERWVFGWAPCLPAYCDPECVLFQPSSCTSHACCLTLHHAAHDIQLAVGKSIMSHIALKNCKLASAGLTRSPCSQCVQAVQSMGVCAVYMLQPWPQFAF
jgi:hypothetical protein